MSLFYKYLFYFTPEIYADEPFESFNPWKAFHILRMLSRRDR